MGLGMMSGSGPGTIRQRGPLVSVVLWAAIGWVAGIVVALIRLGLRKADQASQPAPAPAYPRCGNSALDYGQGYVRCGRCGWRTR